jgi:hypothetical protein
MVLQKIKMKSYFYHIQINISFTNLAWYKDLMNFLGWSVIFETADTIGFKSEQNGDLWFVDNSTKENSDYDKKGMNHLSIRVEKSSDIDDLVAYLKGNSIQPLFETPRYRPEFTSDPNETYYQIMFSSPDNILFEVVYIGLKEK